MPGPVTSARADSLKGEARIDPPRYRVEGGRARSADQAQPEIGRPSTQSVKDPDPELVIPHRGRDLNEELRREATRARRAAS